MNKKWILSLLPISLTIMATTASGQTSQISNAVISSDNQHPNNQSFLPDSSFASAAADSAHTNPRPGWHKAPGQMPIYFFALPPNSMPILLSPPVDEGMILPMGIKAKEVQSDSLQTPMPGNK